VKEVKDARGKMTIYTYDNEGRRPSVKVPLASGGFAETIFTYDANGNQKTVRDANQKTTTFEYDEQNRRTKTIFHDGTYTETTYDTRGQRRMERDRRARSRASTTTSWDGSPLSETSPRTHAPAKYVSSNATCAGVNATS
jgi:YD repeat-containing protein